MNDLWLPGGGRGRAGRFADAQGQGRIADPRLRDRWRLAGGGPYPVGVDFAWEDTTFFQESTRIIAVPGTEDLIASAAAGSGLYARSTARGTVGAANIEEVWAYNGSSASFVDAHNSSYDQATGRAIVGGHWPGSPARQTRVLDADGAFLFACATSAGSGFVTMSVANELGQIWQAFQSTTNAVAIHSAAGATLATYSTPTSGEIIHPGCYAVCGDGSGDVIVFGAGSTSVTQRIHYDGAGTITRVWAQTVARNTSAGGGRPILVDGEVFYAVRNSPAPQHLEIRSVADGSLISSFDITPFLVTATDELMDIHRDARGDFWLMFAAESSSSTSWNVLRFAPDWSLRWNMRDALDPADPMITTFTSRPLRPSSVLVTESGKLVIGGAAVGSVFLAVCGILK